jgi:predicted aminopeptidase
MEANAIIKKNQYKANIKTISNILTKKFRVTREEEESFNEEFRVRRSLAALEESTARKRMAASAAPMSASRYAGPEHIRKDFDEVVEKRKKEEEERRLVEEKRERD